MKTRSDVLICGQLINCLGLRFDVFCHMTITYSHVSVSRSSMLIADDRNTSMPPDLNTGVRATKTEPVASLPGDPSPLHSRQEGTLSHGQMCTCYSSAHSADVTLWAVVRFTCGQVNSYHGRRTPSRVTTGQTTVNRSEVS